MAAASMAGEEDVGNVMCFRGRATCHISHCAFLLSPVSRVFPSCQLPGHPAFIWYTGRWYFTADSFCMGVTCVIYRVRAVLPCACDEPISGVYCFVALRCGGWRVYIARSMLDADRHVVYGDAAARTEEIQRDLRRRSVLNGILVRPMDAVTEAGPYPTNGGVSYQGPLRC